MNKMRVKCRLINFYCIANICFETFQNVRQVSLLNKYMASISFNSNLTKIYSQ